MTNAKQVRARRAATPPPSSRPRPKRPSPAARLTVGRVARPSRGSIAWPWLCAAAVAVAGAALALPLATGGGSPSGPRGPEGIALETGPLIAPASGAASGQPIDGIPCGSGQQLAYHIHAHLSVYVDGRLRPMPGGIGIVSPVAQHGSLGVFYEATTCYYPLHVHAQDGVIHVESPTIGAYTLGQFFDIWRQPLGRNVVAGNAGKLTTYVNGRLVRGNPRSILLLSHEDIQIDVGTPLVAPQSVDWSGTGL